VPQGPATPLRKPALGISADYLLSYSPYLAKPDPDNKLRASLAYSKAGVDSGEIIVRGGTHFDFGDDVSGFFPASLRGIDLGTWYTLAWFDKYLKHDPTADARLLSARWRDDPGTRAVDPAGDANLYSYHYRSRLDITLAGGARRDCEDLRAGCAGQATASDDCAPAKFGFLTLATTTAPAMTCTPCRAHATVDRRSLRVHRRTITPAGRATIDCQPGATLSAPGVRRVNVAIARKTRGRCAFLTTRRRLTRPAAATSPRSSGHAARAAGPLDVSSSPRRLPHLRARHRPGRPPRTPIRLACSTRPHPLTGSSSSAISAPCASASGGGGVVDGRPPTSTAACASRRSMLPFAFASLFAARSCATSRPSHNGRGPPDRLGSPPEAPVHERSG